MALAPTALPAAAVWLGLLVLAGLIFLAQRLRVRHREQLVITTLFWREALEESRARTLFERFRHPLTYLLLCLIAGLLWLSVARLDGRREEGVWHTYLLDASAGMGITDRFPRAVAALEADLTNAPRDRTEVLICGGRVETLLGPGEDRALLRARLNALEDRSLPAAVPSTVESALLGVAMMEPRRSLGADPAGPRGPRRFVVVGDAFVSAEARSALGEKDWLEAIEVPLVDPETDSGGKAPTNRGITALGIAPARSGAFDAVDAMITVTGPDASNARVSLTLGGEELSVTERVPSGDSEFRLFVRDLRPGAGGPAASRVLRASLVGGADALSLDDHAEIELPALRLVRVSLVGTGDPALDELVTSVLALDPAVELVTDGGGADVRIGGTADELPYLAFGTSETQMESILMGAGTGGPGPESALARAVGELGLDRIDADRLAEELGAPLTAGVTELGPSGQRFIALWRELFDPARSSFVESRAFPLVMGRAVRWLGGTQPISPYSAAGRPAPVGLEEPLRGTPSKFAFERFAGEGALLDPRATALTAIQGGGDGTQGSAQGTLTPTDPLTGAPVWDPTSEGDHVHGGAGPWRLGTWILLFAFLLILAEWLLYQRGRIA